MVQYFDLFSLGIYLQRRKSRVDKSIRMMVRNTPTITTWCEGDETLIMRVDKTE